MATAMCGLATAAGSTGEVVDHMGIVAVAHIFIQVTEVVGAAGAATAAAGAHAAAAGAATVVVVAAVTAAPETVVSDFASCWMVAFQGSSPGRRTGTAP